MASRRILKKEIASVMGSLFMKAMICKWYTPDVDQAKLDELISRILLKSDEFVARVSHATNGENKAGAKAYFRALKDDVNKEVEAIVAEMGNLSNAKEA